MRIPQAVRFRLKITAASLIAIAGLAIARPDTLWPGSISFIPNSFAAAAAGPITKITSGGSIYLLQTLGCFYSVQDGLLRTQDSSIDLEMASGGLRNLIAVLVISVSVSVLASKPLWERVLIAASGLPIGLMCGVFRLTVGCLLLGVVSRGAGRLILVDLAGWTTLALAMLCLLVEQKLLSRLLVPPPEREVVPVLRTAKPSEISPVHRTNLQLDTDSSKLPDHSPIHEHRSPVSTVEETTIRHLEECGAAT